MSRVIPQSRPRPWTGPLAGFLFALAAAVSIPAQTALCVAYKGRAEPVYRVHNGFAYVKVDGKLVPVKPERSMLVEVEEFTPVFVAVRNIEVQGRHLNVIGGPDELNSEFRLRATFESAYPLKDVFLVLELDTPRHGKMLFSHEVGDLVPNHPKGAAVAVALPEALGPGRYKMHVYAAGREVFHSQQPEMLRERALTAMVLKRTAAGAGDAPPKPFVGPVPEYPEAMRKAGLKGEAVIGLHLTSQGIVRDPEVRSASDPAFGEAALVAVRQWRFLPRMVGGKPVEAEINMPFGFEPPVVEPAN
jgi:TonB family protein